MENKNKPLFVIPKSENWSSLLLYEKVSIYQKYLNNFHSQFVDKIIVKNIVKNMCNNEIKIASIVKILNNYNDLEEKDINSDYLIKSSHASKWNINIEKDVKYNINELKNNLKNWNRLYKPKEEKQYSYLIPRFFIEEKINDKYYGKNGKAIVYMCRIFYGICRSISVKDGSLRNDYDINWNIIGDNEMNYIEKPKNLNLMIKYAEKMGSLFEFVRMDFYIDNEENIYFSEFTFTPMGGCQTMPLFLEKELSKYWI